MPRNRTMIVRRIGAAPPLPECSGVLPQLVDDGGEDLITLLAHDIRTPLNTIRVGCELLARQVDASDPTATKSIDLIQHAVAQINGIVDDVLGLRHAHADAHVERVVAVLTDVVGRFRPLLDLNQIVLDVKQPEVDCDVMMHRASLRSVLSNLIANSIRFTAPGGKVHVAADYRGDEVRFVVADTGRGISEDELPHVFDRRWHQQREAGTAAGLGLSLVKRTVEAHGGRVAVVSRVGHGTTFTIDLPAAAHRALP